MKNQINLITNLCFQKLLLLNKTDRVKYSRFKNISGQIIIKLMIMLHLSFAKKHLQKPDQENNKEYELLRTRCCNQKRALTSFRDHQRSKCHLAALTFEVRVPYCRNIPEMIKEEHKTKMKEIDNALSKLQKAFNTLVDKAQH